MNNRQDQRISINLPVKLHYFGEEVELSVSEDISYSGFFVRTSDAKYLEKGVVAMVTINLGLGQETKYLAEVVRTTENGAAFQVIDDSLEIAS